MAEQEVAKHTKKVYKIWASKEHSTWHKLREFAIEIVIIVFAVSLSIWLHNYSEKSHKREEATNFLKGLRDDLKKDTAEMMEDSMSYGEQYRFFKQLGNVPITLEDTNLMMKNSWMFANKTVLIPNISRFEAIKSSGKMDIITNKELLDEIINLYEEQIPKLVSVAESVSDDKNTIIGDYFDEKMLFDANKSAAIVNYLQTDERLRYICRRAYSSIPFVKKTYKDVIQQNIKILQMIDKEIGAK
jgi:Family of unknown function (DUF6090)